MNHKEKQKEIIEELRKEKSYINTRNLSDIQIANNTLNNLKRIEQKAKEHKKEVLKEIELLKKNGEVIGLTSYDSKIIKEDQEILNKYTEVGI